MPHGGCEMGTRSFATEVLNPGQCRGRALVLDEPLSFWGGFDPAQGTIIDRHHPQNGACLAGKVLVLPGSRGSAGTPAGLAEAIRRRVGPLAVLLRAPDVNIAIGAMVAVRLYDLEVPVLVVKSMDYDNLTTGDEISVAADGTVTAAANSYC
jgi:predicted aconitase with swiveling domain